MIVWLYYPSCRWRNVENWIKNNNPGSDLILQLLLVCNQVARNMHTNMLYKPCFMEFLCTASSCILGIFKWQHEAIHLYCSNRINKDGKNDNALTNIVQRVGVLSPSMYMKRRVIPRHCMIVSELCKQVRPKASIYLNNPRGPYP